MSILDHIAGIKVNTTNDEVITICNAIIDGFEDDFRAQLGALLLQKEEADRTTIVENVSQKKDAAEKRARHFKVSEADIEKAQDDIKKVYGSIITSLIEKEKLDNPKDEVVDAKALSKAHYQCMVSIHAIRSSLSDAFDVTSEDSIADFLMKLNEEDPPKKIAPLPLPEENATPVSKTPPPKST